MAEYVIRVRIDSSGAGRDLDDIGRNARGASTSIAGVTSQLVGMAAAAYSVSQAFNTISETEQLETRIKQLVGSTENFVETQKFLIDTSRELTADIHGLRQSYAGYLVQVDAGLLTTKEARTITMGFAEAQKALGASNEQLATTNYGLSQALASGIVRAEEFNQVFESMPGLLQSVERGNDMVSGSLRKMINDGKVTSEMFTGLLIKGLKEFEGVSEGAAQTIAGSMTAANTELNLFVNKFSNGIKGTFVPSMNLIAESLRSMSENFEITSAALIVSLGAIVARGFGPLIAATIASTAFIVTHQIAIGISTLGYYAQIAPLTTTTGLVWARAIAMGALTLVTTAATKATALFGALLGGPVGIAIIGGIVAWQAYKTEINEVRIAGIAFVSIALQGYENMRYAAEFAFTFIANVASKMTTEIQRVWELAIAKIQEKFAELLEGTASLAENSSLIPAAIAEPLRRVADSFNAVAEASKKHADGLKATKISLQDVTDSHNERSDAIEREMIAMAESQGASLKSAEQTTKLTKAAEESTKNLTNTEKDRVKTLKELENEEEARQKRIDNIILSLEQQIKMLGMTNAQIVAYKAGLDGANGVEQQHIQNLQHVIDQYGKGVKAAEEMEAAGVRAAERSSAAWERGMFAFGNIASGLAGGGSLTQAFQQSGNVLGKMMERGAFGKDFVDKAGYVSTAGRVAGAFADDDLSKERQFGMAAGAAIGAIWGPQAAALGAGIGDMLGGFIEGETRGGQLISLEAGGEVVKIQGPSGGDIAMDQASAALRQSQLEINALLASVGSSERVQTISGALEASEKGRGGVYSGGILTSGAEFGEVFRGDNLFESGTPTTLTGEQAFKAYTLDLNQAMIQALQSATDAAGWAKAIVAGIDPEDLSLEGIIKLQDELKTGGVIMNNMGDDAQIFFDAWQTGNTESLEGLTLTLYDLWDEAGNTSDSLITLAAKMYTTTVAMQNLGMDSDILTTSLINSVGGIDELIGSLNFFYQQFSDGTALIENATNKFTDSMSGFDELIPDTREQFTQMVIDAQKGGEETEEQYATLLGTLKAADIYYDSIEKAQKEVVATAQKNTVQTVRAVNTISTAVDTLRKKSSGLLDYIREITFGSSSSLETGEQIGRAEQTFMQALLSGDESKILQTAKTYRTLSKEIFGDSEKFAEADKFIRTRLAGVAQRTDGAAEIQAALGSGFGAISPDSSALQQRIEALEKMLIAGQSEANKILRSIDTNGIINTGSVVRAVKDGSGGMGSVYAAGYA